MRVFKRDETCPCGSGRKFEACCLHEQNEADLCKDPLLVEAIACFRLGFFEGAIDRCDKLKKISAELETASAAVEWLSRVYSGQKQHHKKAQCSRYIKQILQWTGQGGPCAAELSWLFFEFWDGKRWRFPNGIEFEQMSPFDQVLAFIDNQHGVLVSFHATAVLGLARLAIEQLNHDVAKRLVNCVLAWRSEFADVADLEKLARLMAELKTPVTLWADWAAYFYQHVQFSNARDQQSSQFVGGKDFADWAAKQNRESRNVLVRVLCIAPPELLDIMKAMIPHFGWSGFEVPLSEVADAANHLRNSLKLQWASPDAYVANWYFQPDIKTRYFWYDMLERHEQEFVTNGDWALFCSPTEDFSMGLAQWWRLIESVFFRIVSIDLGKRFDENPEWLAQDSAILSAKSKTAEAVFLTKLAVAESRSKMTLVDILLVIEKCVVAPRLPEKCDSILRRKATEYFAPFSKQIIESIHAKSSQRLLSIENINWFRNRASHSQPINKVDACVGRLIAKKIVDLLFAPQLPLWGFEANIPVFFDDDENKPSRC